MQSLPRCMSASEYHSGASGWFSTHAEPFCSKVFRRLRNRYTGTDPPALKGSVYTFGERVPALVTVLWTPSPLRILDGRLHDCASE
ncbi:hypothetical protein Tco_0795499 [Tanacetum coccineum]